MQMAFEELCVSYLLNRTDSDIRINAQFEYSKKNKTLQLLVRHNMEQIPPSDFSSKISLTLLKHLSKNITQNTLSPQDKPYRSNILVELDIGGHNEK